MTTTTAVRERPILFSAPLVRAILAGEKSQTRRIVKGAPESHVHDVRTGTDVDDREFGAWFTCRGPQWQHGVASEHNMAHFVRCPYGQPGELLWVKETFYVDVLPWSNGGSLPDPTHEILDNLYYRADGECCQQIPECACAEVGKPKWRPSIFMPRWASRITLEVNHVRVERLHDITEADARAEGTGNVERFRALWYDINGRDSWDQNPWLWVVDFKRL